ncbi:dethiobiotin synthase [Paracoccus sp. JM45]|uniref:dethiobiotin synthase n=1 Tax=Paracoccus sp. JM45 TaxID=2283626 RepID=UPI000E6B7453|nr:dethiobiotin synthase [Paracoccus sp. JM45]RJE79280.1 dethiobiotin synthase [Paracoccus sp. JM45]
MAKIVVTSTGTDVGKTVFSAGLCGLIGADYWKPLQSGLAGNVPNPEARTDVAPTPESDRAEVARLSGARTHPEAYMLSQPLSPHRAAELDGVDIDADRLSPPDADDLVIEGAGGALVPITRRMLFADLFAQWQLPVVLVASTGLGTISHSLSALESLRARKVPVLGVAFIGEDNSDNMATIGQIGQVKVLGRLPVLPTMDRDRLSAAMTANFDPKDFA